MTVLSCQVSLNYICFPTRLGAYQSWCYLTLCTFFQFVSGQPGVNALVVLRPGNGNTRKTTRFSGTTVRQRVANSNRATVRVPIKAIISFV